jgi:hypothetical protein
MKGMTPRVRSRLAFLGLAVASGSAALACEGRD